MIMRKEKKADIVQESASSIREDLVFLLLKIGILMALLVVTFIFVFGIYRTEDNSMFPSVKEGDVVLYYRLQKESNASDVVVIEKDGETQVRRIIAKEGDTIDITDDRLKINGHLQQEVGIYTETLPYREGIKFPLTLEEDEYFVLGDERTNAKDSRVYGAVHKDEIKGSAMTLLRRRGI